MFATSVQFALHCKMIAASERLPKSSNAGGGILASHGRLKLVWETGNGRQCRVQKPSNLTFSIAFLDAILLCPNVLALMSRCHAP